MPKADESASLNVTFGNHRFVGNVGWRQNHQTFDVISLVNSSLDKTTFSYVYVDKVNRIFGDRKAMGSHLANVAIDTGKAGKLAIYAYLLDYDDDVALSTATYGISLTGKSAAGSGNFLYDLEYAQQSDYGDNPLNVDADYYRAELGFGGKKLTGKVGYEVLEGSPGNGRFSTPLATLHKWNGWADKFLATPLNGLEDTWLGLHGKFDGGWKCGAIYHQFSANTGGDDYGDELDLVVTYAADWKQSFGIKTAFYSADTRATDTDKIWIWTSWKI